MPNAVRMFSRLSYGALLIGLLASFYTLPKLAGALGRELDALGGLAFIVPVAVFSLAIPALLVWLAASRRKNWARIVLAVLFVGGLVLTALDPTALRIGGLPTVAVFAIQTLMQGAGLIYAFSTEAKPWFAKGQMAKT